MGQYANEEQQKTMTDMKWFTDREFRCRCCGELPDGSEGGPNALANIRALVANVLDPAREKLGMPVTVNSGYRCKEHNLAVGGVRGSQHLQGEAADIAPAGLKFQDSGFKFQDSRFKAELERLKQIIIENGRFDQLIDYGTFLHVSWKRFGPNRKQKLKKR